MVVRLLDQRQTARRRTERARAAAKTVQVLPPCDCGRAPLISGDLTPEDEVQRLNDAFNEIVARCNTALVAAEDERRAALMAVPEGRAALEAFDEAVQRAEAAAAAAQRAADEARMNADQQAAQTRADAEDRAYAAFLANHAETVRREARRKAEDECDRCLHEVGSRVPPVSGQEMDSARKQAFAARDAAYRAADDACEEGLRQAREALGAANDAALRAYADAAEAAALEHQRQRAAAERAREDAVQAANQEFGRTVMHAREAVAIERAYARARQAIEQRAEAEKQEIYRRLRGG
jgi:hypothetical protein